MPNRKVTLIRNCKTDKGWRRYPAAFSKNGRVRPGWAIVNGVQREFPEGRYQLRFFEGSNLRYKSVGDDAAHAVTLLKKQSQLLVAKDSAANAGAKIVEEGQRVSLDVMKERFIRDAEERGAREAAVTYRTAVEGFQRATGCTYADAVTADHIRAYWRAMHKQELSPRTIHNRHMNLSAFLRFCGVTLRDIIKPPKFEKSLPETYSSEELTKFFESLESDYDRLAFTLLRKTGLREQEAIFLEWREISFKGSVLHLHSKPDVGFTIKDKEERLIPIPNDLLALLKELRAERPKARFVLGTATNRPNFKLLRTLKRRVRAANLGCNVCDGCARGECERWFLHKFRATYATTLLRSGVDLRTVMAYMGHSSIESTMRYLSPASAKESLERINQIEWQ